MKKLLLIFFIIASLHSSAQKIYGTVFNDKGDLLPYASVTIKGTSIGASANNKAKFSFNLSPGSYTVVCQHIGFTRQEKTVVINTVDEEVTFILTEQKLDLKEIIVKSGGRSGLRHHTPGH